MVSFQKKIFLYYVILIVIVLGMLGTFFFVQVNGDLKQSSETFLKERSDEAANQVAAFLSKQTGNVRIMAGNTILRSAKFSLEEKRETLNLFKQTLDMDEISLISSNGNVIVSTASTFKNDWNGEKAFQSTLKGDKASFVEDRSLWFLSPIQGNQNIIAARLPLSVLWELIDAMQIGTSGFVFVLDSSGKAIAHPDKDFIGQEVYQTAVDTLLPEGIIELQGNVIAAYSTLFEEKQKMDEWKVFALQPKSEAFLTLTSFSTNVVIALIAALVLALTIGFVFSSRVIRPLSKLAKGAKQITTGEISRVDITSQDEVGDIASSFNHMAGMMKEKELLQRLKGDLQEKVKEMEKINKIMMGREEEIAKLKKKLAGLEEKLKKRSKA